MGEQRNLTEENVEGLRAVLDKMQESNPELEYSFFKQNPLSPCCHAKIFFNHATGDECCSICGDRIIRNDAADKYGIEQDKQLSNKKIFEKLEVIERKLDLIFGDHVLFDGQFKLIK